MNHIRQSKCLFLLVKKNSMANIIQIKDKTTGEVVNASDELNGVMIYIQTVISNDFSTNYLTPYIMLLTMLEYDICEANHILSKYILTEDIEKLILKLSNDISLINIQYHGENIGIDDELIEIFGQAWEEAKKMGDKELGSKHVLLAMINENSKFPSGSLLLPYVNYNMVLA